jgi:hypothetical protein
MVGVVGGPTLLLGPQPWLCQGDIFSDIPLIESGMNESGLDVEVAHGPALLLTHGCALDKKTRAGAFTVRRLHFLPLRATASLPPEQQSTARRKRAEVAPAEVLYLGEVPGLTEAHVLLSEPFYLPAALFEIELAPFQQNETDHEEWMLVARAHDSRVARLAPSHVEVLLDKINAYWTRREPLR